MHGDSIYPNLSSRGTSAHTGDVAIRPPEALNSSEGVTGPRGETDCHANAAALARNDAVGSASQIVNAVAVLSNVEPSNTAYQRPDGVYVVPLTALKN